MGLGLGIICRDEVEKVEVAAEEPVASETPSEPVEAPAEEMKEPAEEEKKPEPTETNE